MESRRLDVPLLISIDNHLDENADHDEIIEEPSLREIQECIKILESGERFCSHKFSCGLITLLIVTASLLAFADAIRRSASCTNGDDVCDSYKYPEYILGIFGLILALISGVTACNTQSQESNLMLLSERKFNKIRETGNKLGMDIQPDQAMFQTLMSFKHQQRIYRDMNSAGLQANVGLFADKQRVNHSPNDEIEIVISTPK